MQWGRKVKGKKIKLSRTYHKGKGEIRGIAPLILNLGARRRSEVCVRFRALYPRERTPIPFEINAGGHKGRSRRVWGKEDIYYIHIYIFFFQWLDSPLGAYAASSFEVSRSHTF
jgi:hypothetical protein